jgi:hypothetical protein
MVLDTVDSDLDGIMTGVNVICLCQDMLSVLSNASNIRSHPTQNIPHIIGTYSNVEPRFKMLMQRIPHHCWMQWTNNRYRKSSE